MKPRLLDLFCGAGGAAMGYHRAGFDVVGVDIKPQPHYPFEFHRQDVFELLASTPLKFDFVHASPPCQLFSRAGKLRDAQGGRASSVDLVGRTRFMLQASGAPYVIENVPGSPIQGVTVCGSAFGLGVRRHRLFESPVALQGTVCDHKAQGRPIGVYHVPNDDIPQGGRTARDLAEGKQAMGVDWDVTWNELKEMVPPAYTEWIGRQLLASIERAA
jgi:DNA (cytosine-5)-methyltransferase 1